MSFKSLLSLLRKPKMLLVLRVVFVALIGFELYVSLVPVDLERVNIPGVDKVLHIAMHAVNVMFAALVFPLAVAYKIGLYGLFLLGPLIEGLQALTPAREASLGDQIANMVGFGLAYLLAARFRAAADRITRLDASALPGGETA